MGTGTSVTVTGTGLATTGYKYSCYVLPQSLSTVSMTISTTDGNTYPVTINTKTSDWLIGKHYTYTLTLKKTGIVLTATLTDWVNVNNDIPDVHL
jgi:heptaprenylglyceryl phosphate synthase